MLAGTFAVGAGTAAADATLAAGLPSNVKVAMKGNTVAWSARTAGGRWKLVIWRAGVARDAAVAPSRWPFDVDLGDDGHGRLLATYSRCIKVVGLERPRGCDVYRYDVTSRRERRVRGLGNGSASDYLPTASGGQIAFGAVDRRRPRKAVPPRSRRRRTEGDARWPEKYRHADRPAQPRPWPTRSGDRRG